MELGTVAGLGEAQKCCAGRIFRLHPADLGFPIGFEVFLWLAGTYFPAAVFWMLHCAHHWGTDKGFGAVHVVARLTVIDGGPQARHSWRDAGHTAVCRSSQMDEAGVKS